MRLEIFKRVEGINRVIVLFFEGIRVFILAEREGFRGIWVLIYCVRSGVRGEEFIFRGIGGD